MSDMSLNVRDKRGRSTELDVAIDPGESEVRLSLNLTPEIYLSPAEALAVADSLKRAAQSVQAAQAGDLETLAALWWPQAP